jgi:hypothetical protein
MEDPRQRPLELCLSGTKQYSGDGGGQVLGAADPTGLYTAGSNTPGAMLSQYPSKPPTRKNSREKGY